MSKKKKTQFEIAARNLVVAGCRTVEYRTELRDAFLAVKGSDSIYVALTKT